MPKTVIPVNKERISEHNLIWYTNIHIVHRVGFISLLLLFENSGWRLNSKSGLDRSILPDLATAPTGEGFNKRNQNHLKG